MADRSRRTLGLLFGAVAVLALGATVFFLLAPGSTAAGPVPIVWNKELCARCKMHVGEPAFAAQLQTRQGEVLSFDDPGCLFEYVELHHPDAKATYFHDAGADRWLSSEEAAFVRKNPTPMGFGIGAVPRGTPGSIPLEQARNEALERLERTAGPR